MKYNKLILFLRPFSHHQGASVYIAQYYTLLNFVLFIYFKYFIVKENTNEFDHKFSNIGSAIPVSNLLHSFMVAYELIVKHSILKCKLKMIML